MQPEYETADPEPIRAESPLELFWRFLTFGGRPRGQVFLIWRLILGVALFAIGVSTSAIGLLILGLVILGGVPFLRACWNGIIH